MPNLSRDPWAVARRIAREAQAVFGENLAGVYVHGSLAFGCFCWEKSDIDLLLPVHAAPDMEQKARFIRFVMDCPAPPKGVELSAVPLSACRDPRPPLPYFLHDSPAHRDAYARDLYGHLRALQGTDPDLPAHFAVAHAVGKAVLGPPAREVFAPVRRGDYWQAIRYDLMDLVSSPEENPLYTVLNLFRALAFYREDRLLSKRDGALWALNQPDLKPYAPLAEQALAAYGSTDPFCPDRVALAALARDLSERMRLNEEDPV